MWYKKNLHLSELLTGYNSMVNIFISSFLSCTREVKILRNIVMRWCHQNVKFLFDSIKQQKSPNFINHTITMQLIHSLQKGIRSSLMPQLAYIRSILVLTCCFW
mmetsp:Transcript_6351/g.10103  ORF Transcript_6351/g.10103 Transcript_6351/m.10103 type:complete len:104 (-) Transcript_6351:2233-2544(-)